MLLLGQYQLIFPEMNKSTWLATVSSVLIWAYALVVLWINLGKPLLTGYSSP
jgi:hypothetical protein